MNKLSFLLSEVGGYCFLSHPLRLSFTHSFLYTQEIREKGTYEKKERTDFLSQQAEADHHGLSLSANLPLSHSKVLEKWNILCKSQDGFPNNNTIISLPGNAPHLKLNISPIIPRVPICWEGEKPQKNKVWDVQCFDDEWGWVGAGRLMQSHQTEWDEFIQGASK